MTTLRDRIKAACPKSGTWNDSALANEARELLPLVLAEMDDWEDAKRDREHVLSMKVDELAAMTVERDRLRDKRQPTSDELDELLARGDVAELRETVRDMMGEALKRVPGHTCTGSGQPPRRGCVICDSAPKPEGT